MTREDSSTSSQSEPLSQANASLIEETQGYLYGMKAASFFPVTGRVTFKPMTAAPERGAWHLPPGVARLVCLASLGAVLLGPLSGCNSLGGSDVPCPVPTPNTTGTPVSDGTPTATCTTSSGTHYLWIHSLGGWVPSDDGVHPNPNSHGVGEDEGHSGVGDGHGEGHGGGEGG